MAKSALLSTMVGENFEIPRCEIAENRHKEQNIKKKKKFQKEDLGPKSRPKADQKSPKVCYHSSNTDSPPIDHLGDIFTYNYNLKPIKTRLSKTKKKRFKAR